LHAPATTTPLYVLSGRNARGGAMLANAKNVQLSLAADSL